MNLDGVKDKSRPTMNLSDFIIESVEVTIHEDVYGDISAVNLRIEESNGIRSYFTVNDVTVIKIIKEKFEVEEQ